jgi:hypothetical protein
MPHITDYGWFKLRLDVSSRDFESLTLKQDRRQPRAFSNNKHRLATQRDTLIHLMPI